MRCVVAVAVAVAALAVCASADSVLYGIEKLGTVDMNMVETTPIIWKGKPVRLESVRGNYPGNAFNHTTAYFRFRDVASNTVLSPPFGLGFAFGCAVVVDGSVYVFGTNNDNAGVGTARTVVGVWWSSDLSTFHNTTALTLPSGYEAFNTNVAPVTGLAPPAHPTAKYVMAIELGAPSSVVGDRFTMVFAATAAAEPTSGWQLLPVNQFVYNTAYYSACPTIRYLPQDGNFYMAYLRSWAGPNGTYAEDMVRSADLQTWEESAYNPFLVHTPDDYKPTPNTALTAAEQAYAAKCQALDIDASDIDWVEVPGSPPYVLIDFNWGSQTNACEFLAEARFNGTQEQFLTQFFVYP